MAGYKDPPKHGQIKKGEVRNPLGAGAHNKELRAIRRLTQDEVAEVGSMILGHNLERLKATRSDPASSVFKVWVCSVAITAINKGDAVALNVILDRIVGRVKTDLELSGGLSVEGANKATLEIVRALRAKTKDDC